MEEKKFWICANLSGLGPARLKKLVAFHGSIEKVFQLGFNELKESGVPDKVAWKIERWEQLPWKKEIEFCRENNVRIVTFHDAEYPLLLKHIYDPPYMLYVKGHIPETDKMLAVVGTRNPSFYGIRMAEKLATELAYYGFAIVSGLAKGIDAAAHRGALRGNGKTAGVLGSGFNNFYPRENLKLADSIKENGAVITEFNFSARPEPGHFPLRNRIVSGMSKGTLVVEAGQKSGALITANCALEQGREVFALPGQVDNLFSKGVNRLLKEGATLVENIQDILDSLNLEIKNASSERKSKEGNLTETEKKIMEAAGKEKINVEELISKTGLNAREISDALIRLVIKGMLSELPGKIYTAK